MGSDDLFRRDVQRIGCQHEIGLVSGQEFEHGSLHGALLDPVPQALRRQPGQRQQAVGTLLVRQDPSQRAQRQRLGIRMPPGRGLC